MSGGAVISAVGAMLPRWRDPSARERLADILAVLVAAALPWGAPLCNRSDRKAACVASVILSL